jgi:hypothetical protein
MSGRGPTGTPPQRVRGAKGAAQEAIGKLIGDDAAVRKGRAKQRSDDRAAENRNKEQE